ncbi:MAG: preprotein translocase subunit YajC [Phycisphaeraceae bacterium]|nr:preprotein translocase subunit YajC [Phycisphaeraceae bacterium]
MLALDGQPLLLAQPGTDETGTTATPDGAAPGEEGANPSAGGGFDLFTMMLIFGAVIIFMMMLGGGSRKQKKKQQEMLSAMSKGDKVVSIGGIKGSIVEVREDEVVVKVDENNNTRMKFSKEAIREVVTEKAEKE